MVLFLYFLIFQEFYNYHILSIYYFYESVNSRKKNECFLFYKINHITGVLITNWVKSPGIFMTQFVLLENKNTNKEYLGIPLWLSGLRIQSCHCYGSSHSYGMGSISGPDSIPGPGTSVCHEYSQKEKNTYLCLNTQSCFNLQVKFLNYIIEKFIVKLRIW